MPKPEPFLSPLAYAVPETPRDPTLILIGDRIIDRRLNAEWYGHFTGRGANRTFAVSCVGMHYPQDPQALQPVLTSISEEQGAREFWRTLRSIAVVAVDGGEPPTSWSPREE